VGRDASNPSNRKGVLLKFAIPHISVTPTKIDFGDVGDGAFLRRTVTVKNSGNADLMIQTVSPPELPFSIETDGCSGESLARTLSCKIVYRFDPVIEGAFDGTSDISSNDPDNPLVTVTLGGSGVAGPPLFINLSNPSDGETFTACSLYDPPVFQWEPSEAFRSMELQFSPGAGFLSIPVKAKGKKGINELLAKSSLWKKIFTLPGTDGGTVYWKILGKRADNTFVESIVFSMEIGAPEPVLNPGLSHTSRTALPPPAISWENACAVKFKAWFGNDPDFAKRGIKKKTLSFKVKNPNDIGGELAEPLTESEWKAIRKLVQDASGAKIYWYVESWDGAKRYVQTPGMEFELTE
jgi:hypothetical protein